MSISIGLGERRYTFSGMAAVARARALFACCSGTQNEFEEQMENDGIEFGIESYPD